MTLAPEVTGSSFGVAVLDPFEAGALGVALPCRIHDPDLWFADRPADLEAAKNHCSTCPIRSNCLAGAQARREPWGVWGGEIFDRGIVVAHKRPRGRPPKGVRK